MNLTQRLQKRKLITPPPWLPDNVMYETYMGSMAYGVVGTSSDRDIYGFCIPPKEVVFPHLAGHIYGFGEQPKTFWQYQEHHIQDPTALGGKGVEYDITIYNIVKYFQLCMQNNPNMIDSLFTPTRCVITRTQIWEMVHEKRKIFLHKGCWPKFKGYAYSQLHKMQPKFEEDVDGNVVRVWPQGTRREMVKKHGYDLKFAYHLVRLLGEVEQILVEHDLDLERNSEQLKAIRRGEWLVTDVEEYFYRQEQRLEDTYKQSTLPWVAREDEIRQLLLDCLEHHYGSLANVIPDAFDGRDALRTIYEIVQRALT